MKKSVFIIALLGLPAAIAAQVIDLSGSWQFGIDRENKFTPTQQLTETIELPGSMVTREKGDPVSIHTQWTGSLYDSSFYFNPKMAQYRTDDNIAFPFFLTPKTHYVGAAWYKKSVNIPKSMKGKTIVLTLERPHIETTVFVNGTEVGHQMSLSVAHKYDITKFVNFGKDNTIAIKVYNGIENVCVGQDSHSVTDQTQGNWNGITGQISISAGPLITKITAKPNIANGSVLITVNEQQYNIKLDQPIRLWSEFDPYLYTVEVDYKGTKVPVTFGMREITTNGRNILLNGQPIYLRGTVENCCFPNTGYAPTDVDSWMNTFRKCKSYGLNHMRFHSFCPPEAAFIAADSLGFYLQPEGPSWTNHGVKFGRGLSIDQYIIDECKAIVDAYGSHPSFVFLAGGNEPAGDWVAWGKNFNKVMKEYDNSRLYCTASVGGGWAWDEGSDFHVKGGGRGLDWNNKAPQSVDDYYAQLLKPRNFKGDENTEPIIAHEHGQWCAYPDFREIPKYQGAYKARNFEIFRDLAEANGLILMADKFLAASSKLQHLAYKYETERNLRTKDYSGFQYLGLNDYSGQGTALVGPLNVFWEEKSWQSLSGNWKFSTADQGTNHADNDWEHDIESNKAAEQWRTFCSEVVPLAKFNKFVFTDSDTLSIPLEIYNASGAALENYACSYEVMSQYGDVVLRGTLPTTKIPAGKNFTMRPISFTLNNFMKPCKYTLNIYLAGDEKTYRNNYDFWVYPSKLDMPDASSILITDTLDEKAFNTLSAGGKVLLLAAGKVTFGNDVKHKFLPVFWNTSWFKMRPPHTTGAYIDNEHPLFRNFPTDNWQNLNWWELVNNAQVMNLAQFPINYMPPFQPIDTWHVSRRLGMIVEANALGGKLLITTMDLQNNLNERIVARQMRYAILTYMLSEEFIPMIDLDAHTLMNLFTKEAPAVNMFTSDSPDELKPKIVR